MESLVDMNYLTATDPWLNLTYSLTNELGMAIVGGELMNPDSFFTMTEISKTYQVSLNVVREAMKILYAKGLLTINPRNGVAPTHQEKWNLFDPDVLEWALSSNSARVFFLELEELRMAIEPAAAGLAAANFTNTGDINLILNALEKMKGSKSGTQELLDAENDFYLAILTTSKNPYFVGMNKCIKASNNLRFSLKKQSEENLHADINSYQEIFNAIASGDQLLAFKKTMLLARKFARLMKDFLSNEGNHQLQIMLSSGSNKLLPTSPPIKAAMR